MDRDGNLRGGKDNRKTWDTYRLLAPLRPSPAQGVCQESGRQRETGDKDKQRQKRNSKASRTSESADLGGSAGPLTKVSAEHRHDSADTRSWPRPCWASVLRQWPLGPV